MYCSSLRKTIFAAAVGLLVNQSVGAVQVFSNLKDVQKKLGFNSYYSTEFDTTPIKVAVLDQGFSGYKDAIGKALPANTVYHPGPVAPIEGAQEVEHGRVMAEIFYQLVSDQGRNTLYQPTEFHLYNVAGFSNLKAAIDDIVKNKIDLVLYSEVWQLGSNWDGKGFLNAQINRATQAGVIWINAAGNFATRTYVSEIKVSDDQVDGAVNWVQLPDANSSIKVICKIPKEAKQEKCAIKAYLSWNDFKDEEGVGTDKDLDFALTDDLLNIIKSSSLTQTTLPEKDFTDKSMTNYPRESIVAEVAPGTYFLRVKRRSDNFADQDRLRITVDGDFLTVPSGQADESLLNPADNASVVTVGASDSERSSRSSKLGKPDIYAPSSLKLAEDDVEFRGSSNAAAIVAAGFAMIKSIRPDADSATILKWATKTKANTEVPHQGQGWGDIYVSRSQLLSSDLRFGPPTGSSCYPELAPHDLGWSSWPYNIEVGAVNKGGRVVMTSVGVKIILPYDPIELNLDMQRIAYDDIIFITSSGYNVQPRRVLEGRYDRNWYEVFQVPADYDLCSSSSAGGTEVPKGKSFFMPKLKK